MQANRTVEEYDRRLKQLPQINKEIEEEIRSLTSLVQDQCTPRPTQRMRLGLRT